MHHTRVICGLSPSVPLKAPTRVIVDELCYLPPSHQGDCKFGRVHIEVTQLLDIILDATLKPGEWRFENRAGVVIKSATHTTIRKVRYPDTKERIVEIYPASMYGINPGFEGELRVVDSVGRMHKLTLLEAHHDHFVAECHPEVAVGRTLVGK